jgi:hypothetical protein
MSQPMIITVPASNDGQPVDSAVIRAEESAAESTDAAAVSVSASEVAEGAASVSVDAADESANAAEVSEVAAEVSVTAAGQSVATVETVVKKLDTLIERFALVTAVNKPQEPATPEVKPESDVDGGSPAGRARAPIERKPDRRPADTHWYTRKRGGRS